MLYSIIDAALCEVYGFKPALHKTIVNGTKMVVNENELRLVNNDIEEAARTLQGVVMSQAEVVNEIKRLERNE